MAMSDLHLAQLDFQSFLSLQRFADTSSYLDEQVRSCSPQVLSQSFQFHRESPD